MVHNVAFSPDGKTLAATANDGDIRVWDLDELNIDRIEESTPQRRSLSGGSADRLFPEPFPRQHIQRDERDQGDKLRDRERRL